MTFEQDLEKLILDLKHLSQDHDAKIVDGAEDVWRTHVAKRDAYSYAANKIQNLMKWHNVGASARNDG